VRIFAVYHTIKWKEEVLRWKMSYSLLYNA